LFHDGGRLDRVFRNRPNTDAGASKGATAIVVDRVASLKLAPRPDFSVCLPVFIL